MSWAADKFSLSIFNASFRIFQHSMRNKLRFCFKVCGSKYSNSIAEAANKYADNKIKKRRAARDDKFIYSIHF
jgi:hypothetical protein